MGPLFSALCATKITSLEAENVMIVQFEIASHSFSPFVHQ